MAGLPALAEVADLEVRLGLAEGSLDGADLARAQAALDDASALARLAGNDEWTIDTDPAVPAAVQVIVLRVAKRAYLNPADAQSETTGPYTVRRGDAYLTKQERADVGRFGGTGRRALWTQPTTRGDCDGTVWVDDQYGTELFPLYAADDVIC